MSTRKRAHSAAVLSKSVSSAPPPEVVAKGKYKAVFCDVVVHGLLGNHDEGWRIPSSISSVVSGLGERLLPASELHAIEAKQQQAGSLAATLDAAVCKHPQGNPEKLGHTIRELRDTEATFSRRLQILHHNYALPLRNMASDKSVSALSTFEARTLFGTLDNLLKSQAAFVADLELALPRKWPKSSASLPHWASVVHRHLQLLESPYSAYDSNYESAKDVHANLITKSPSFVRFSEDTKSATRDIVNGSGLKELLMEPMQRMARIRMLLINALEQMPIDDPYRPQISASISIAHRIASRDVDETTKRAAVLLALQRAIEGLPASVFKADRYFIDAIDVFDIPLNANTGVSAATPSPSTASLACTLFLFNDQIIIAKRAPNNKSGLQLTGLDDINKLTQDMSGERAGSRPSSRNGRETPTKNKKHVMTYRGSVNLAHIDAKDLHQAEFALHFQVPPNVPSHRWTGRPLRHFGTATTADVASPQSVKHRFLTNLWGAKALQNSASGLPIVLKSDISPKSRAGSEHIQAFWCIHESESYREAPHKAKIALQLTTRDTSKQQIETGYNDKPPHIVACAILDDRSSICSLTMKTRGEHVTRQEDALDIEDIATVMVEATVSSRVYDAPPRVPGVDFPASRPTSPITAQSPSSIRRLASSGLDSISKSFFSGSVSSVSARRSRSMMSKISNVSASTDPSSFRSDSMRSSATMTSTATSLTSAYDSQPSSMGEKGRSRRKPVPTDDYHGSSLARAPSRASSVASSRYPDTEYDTNEDTMEIMQSDLQPMTRSGSENESIQECITFGTSIPASYRHRSKTPQAYDPTEEHLRSPSPAPSTLRRTGTVSSRPLGPRSPAVPSYRNSPAPPQGVLSPPRSILKTGSMSRSTRSATTPAPISAALHKRQLSEKSRDEESPTPKRPASAKYEALVDDSNMVAADAMFDRTETEAEMIERLRNELGTTKNAYQSLQTAYAELKSQNVALMDSFNDELERLHSAAEGYREENEQLREERDEYKGRFEALMTKQRSVSPTRGLGLGVPSGMATLRPR